MGEAPAHDVRAERRSDDREIAVLRYARLDHGCGDGLCLVRNLSQRGALIEIVDDEPIGAPLLIELPPHSGREASVRWRRGRQLGVQFTEPVDVARLLGETPVSEAVRSPRFRRSVLIRTIDGAVGTETRLENISVGGACIRVGSVNGRSFQLDIPGLPPTRAYLRWAADGRGGLSFQNPLRFAELASWLAARSCPGTWCRSRR